MESHPHMKRQSARMDQVDSPIIPTIAALVRNNPGTISLGQGVVNYGPPEQAISALPELMADKQLHKYQAVSGIPPLVEASARSWPTKTMCTAAPNRW